MRTATTAAFYETDRAVSEYLLFHYGEEAEILPWEFGPRESLSFPVRCVQECLDPARLPSNARALDLGCAVGRSSFELARHCAEVRGIDLSERFIAVARAIRDVGQLEYSRLVEGGFRQNLMARAPEGIDRRRVEFEVGDAARVDPAQERYDVVLAANLIDRLPRPREFLQGLEAHLKSGGQLILTSPYTWTEEYTPPEEWLTAEGRRTSEVLPDLLRGFEFRFRRDLPMLIREHERKYQWTVVEATVWQRC